MSRSLSFFRQTQNEAHTPCLMTQERAPIMSRLPKDAACSHAHKMLRTSNWFACVTATMVLLLCRAGHAEYSPLTHLVQIAPGGGHTCGLTQSHGVKCWGDNDWGQLGIGNTAPSAYPVDVAGLVSGVESIGTGESHTCVLTEAGGVKCWGNNSDGELGLGSTGSPVTTPADVPALATDVKAISVGNHHTCALLLSGGVKCWGSNFYGELGNGSTADSPTPVDVIGLGNGVKAISAGKAHTCALLDTGNIECWGNNGSGRLGDGTASDSSSPVAVLGLDTSAAAVSAGYNHTCALLTDGSVMCWGNNKHGELGNGSEDYNSYVPVEVAALGSSVVAISTSGASPPASSRDGGHTCALLSSGTVRCWGYDSYGQLGNGATTDANSPVDANLGPHALAVEAGSEHTCALIDTGEALCWGRSDDGQLGIGAAADASGTDTIYRLPVDVNGATDTIDVNAGEYHTCALTATGAAQCWGFNTHGQLGNGSIVNSTFPVDVLGLGSGVQAIATGYDHTCALLGTSVVECWGYNGFGQLGIGVTDDDNITMPTELQALGSGIRAIATGYRHSCAVLDAGTVKCWGDNYYGELGDGTTVDSPTPVDVVGLTDVQSIVAGQSHTCALLESGTVKCWGYNFYGQLGNGTTTASILPVDVVGLAGVHAISAGESFTCALFDAGTIKCWGRNSAGQLGDASYINATSPVVVSGIAQALAVSAGGSHACALLTEGTTVCWGEGQYGQLGTGTTTNSAIPALVQAMSSTAASVDAGIRHTCAVTTAGSIKCWGYNQAGLLGTGKPGAVLTPQRVVVEVAPLLLSVTIEHVWESGARYVNQAHAEATAHYRIHVIKSGTGPAIALSMDISMADGFNVTSWTCNAPAGCTPSSGADSINAKFVLGPAADSAVVDVDGEVEPDVAFVELRASVAPEGEENPQTTSETLTEPVNGIGLFKDGFED
ncbi:MAG TPA: hypothetical protein VFN09_01305 [Rhodanobacteraceae bacterium]|nr:hypothetical protein [Rhodanobacteraceae bacterium]